MSGPEKEIFMGKFKNKQVYTKLFTKATQVRILSLIKMSLSHSFDRITKINLN